MILVFLVQPTFLMLSSSVAKLFETDGTTLIIAVGNTLRHDDGVGPYIAEQLRNSKFEVLDNVQIINVEEKPERAIDEAARVKPAKTIIIDAADFGGKVGEVRIIDIEDIPATTLSTHTFPLPIIAKIIEEDSKAPVYFLGVQPARMDLGEGLSCEVLKTAEEVIKLCTKCTC